MGLMAALVAITATSAYVSYDTQRKADKNAQAKDEADRRLLNDQAAEEERLGELEAKRIRDAAGKLKGKQTAALAASGVKLFEGTAGDLLSETDTLSEFDALEAIRQSKTYAKNLRNKGASINTPSYAGSVLLQGALNTAYAGVWSYDKYKKDQNAKKENDLMNN